MCKDCDMNFNELDESISVEDPMINGEAVDGTYYEFLNDIKTSTSADKDDFCSLFIYL
jgi:hypothetical protein